MTPDTWHLTPDIWHLTPDTEHVTPDMWHMVRGEHYLKISASQLLPFGIYDVLKIWRKRLTHLINESQSCLWNSPGYTGSVNNFKKVGEKNKHVFMLRALEQRFSFFLYSLWHPINGRGQRSNFCPVITLIKVKNQWKIASSTKRVKKKCVK